MCGLGKYPGCECDSLSPSKRLKHDYVSENTLVCGYLGSAEKPEAHVHEIVFVMFSWSNKTPGDQLKKQSMELFLVYRIFERKRITSDCVQLIKPQRNGLQ